MRNRLPKWSSVRYRIKEVFNLFEHRQKEKKELFAFKQLLNKIKKEKDCVIVGANFARSGGVRNHILAIEKYCKSNIQLIPLEAEFGRFRGYHFKEKYKDLVNSWELPNVKAIHSHVYPWMIEWSYLQKQKGIKWIHTYHLPYFPEHSSGVIIEKWQNEINEALENQACHADIKLSVSKWQQDYLRDKHGIETEYLPNGVDINLCDQGNGANFKKEIRMDHFILNVSRHDPVKNPAEFVRLATSMPEKQFVIIGPGLSKEVFLTEYQVEVPENLLIYGPASHKKVQDAIAACDILVSCAKKEGLPTLVMEGMAHKKAVIVSDEPGSMEAIDQGNYGYYYTIGDMKDLQNKVNLAILDTEIGEKARKRVLEEYDWKVVAQKLDKIYLNQ